MPVLDTSMPLHLIPVPNQPETCVLVLEHTVCLITTDDVACGNVLYAKSQPHPVCPLFTAYDTMRPEQGSQIYLGSTEGYLYQLTCTSEMTWSAPVQIHSVAALCVLGPFQMPEAGVVDLVVYAGESADGAVLAVSLSASRFTLVYALTLLLFPGPASRSRRLQYAPDLNEPRTDRRCTNHGTWLVRQTPGCGVGRGRPRQAGIATHLCKRCRGNFSPDIQT